MVKCKSPSIAAVLCFAACSAAVCLPICAGEAVPASGTKPPEPLEWALNFGSAIPAKPHLSERSACQYEAAKACLDLGYATHATGCADYIANWRRGVLLADIAGHYARLGDTDGMMREFLDKAYAFRDQVTGFNKDWQRARVTARIGAVLARAGMIDEAKTVTDGCHDPAVVQVRVEELARVAEGADPADNLRHIRVLGKSTVLEAIQAAVEAYTRLVENHGHELRTPHIDELANGLAAALARLPVLLQGRLCTDAGRALIGNGWPDQGLRLLSETVAAMEERGLNPRFDVAALAQIAEVHDEVVGDKKRAGELLKRASDLLKNAKLTRDERVSAAIALAQAYTVHGDEQTAWRHYHDALKRAGGQPNGRPRHVMLTDLCVAIGRSGVALPDDFRTALAEQWNRRGEPW